MLNLNNISTNIRKKYINLIQEAPKQNEFVANKDLEIFDETDFPDPFKEKLLGQKKYYVHYKKRDSVQWLKSENILYAENNDAAMIKHIFWNHKYPDYIFALVPVDKRNY